MLPASSIKTISLENGKVFLLKSATYHNRITFAFKFQKVLSVEISEIGENSARLAIFLVKKYF